MTFARAAAALLSLVWVGFPSASGAPATPAQRALIAANVPRAAYAAPERPRRLLIYTETKGFRHSSIEVGIEAISLMGERTGAYTATAAATPDVLSAENLRNFDAVLFLNTTGNLFQMVETRAALLEFVRNGGGIAGIHSATDTCYDWPEWGQMMGGYFDGHPWSADFHVTIQIEEPDHPLNAAFGGRRSFFVQDEIYQLKDPYSRETHRVLTSLDPRRAQFDHPQIAPRLKRSDLDYAVTQIREYGRGRVFYCSLGHNEHIYWNPTVMGHYLAGLQWVLGDLKAPASPRPRGALPPLADDDALYETAARTRYTDTQLPFQWLDDAIAEAGSDAAALAGIERRLVEMLGHPDTTPAARQEASFRLGRLIPANPSARRATLPALAPLLRSPEVSEVNLGRAALEPVAGRAVDDLFLSALRLSSGEARLALIQAVGQRRQQNAVPVLRDFLTTGEPAVAAAAAEALGAIGTSRAAAALARGTGPAVAQARLVAAGNLSGRAATRIFSELKSDQAAPLAVRTGALRGLIAADPSRAVARIEEALSEDQAFRDVALEAVASLPSRDLVARLGARFDGYDDRTQVALLEGFARRGEAAAVPVAMAAARSESDPVRFAAVSALGRLPGSAESVALLASLAAGSGDLARRASANLAILRGPGVGAWVKEGARSAEAALRPTYVRQLALRGMDDALPYLLSLRDEPLAAVRLAALEALDLLAPATEREALLAWSLGAVENVERNRAVRALIAVTLRDPNAAMRTLPIVAAIDRGTREDRLLLLPALARLPDEPVLAACALHARDRDPAVAAAALDVLVRWPDAGAIEALLSHAEDPATSPEARALAAQAATRHYERATDFPKTGRSAALERLLAVTTDPARARHLLFLLSQCDDERALAAARALAGKPDLAEAAEEAIASIEANKLWPPELAASGAGNRLRFALDGDDETFWSVPAREGQWLRIDFKRTRPLRRLTLSHGVRRNEFPQAYAVHVTDDPENPGPALIEGQGTRAATVIAFPEGTRGRYVIVRQTLGREENPAWAVARIRIE